MEQYTPPQNFIPAGDVIPEPITELPYTIDDEPTAGSSNPVKSGGIKSALDGKENSLPPSPATGPEGYFLDGNKNWRSLIDKVVELYEAVREERWEVTWDDITGKPADIILEESDPTVPEYIKALSETEIEALKWLTQNFPRTDLTPGSALFVSDDGQSLTTKTLGEMLSVFFPGLTTLMADIISDLEETDNTIDNLQAELAALVSNADPDTTTAFSRNTIDCQFQPQFVEIFEDAGQTCCRPANEYIHGVVFVSVPRGGTATIMLPSVKIKGFSDLIPGDEYALDVVTRDIVDYDEESETQLYIGYAVSETEIEFPHKITKKKKKDRRPLELWCQPGAEAPAGDTPLDLICAGGGGTLPPPPAGNTLVIGELESASSSFSYYTTNLTASGKRPVIAFSARLNGVIVPFGSDLQYSIDAGVTWHTCGKYGSGKHVAEGNVSTLPLMLDFETPYTLVTRLSINTAVVSNVLNVTTGPEPDMEEEVDDDMKRYIVWNVSQWGTIQENGLWDIAYDSGVRVLAPVELFHWSKFEQGEGNYNFEDLEYYFEKAANKGYQILIWGFPRHALPRSVYSGPDKAIGGEWLWRRKSGGGWERYYKNYHDSSFLPDSSWERDRYGNIAGSKGYNFGVSSSFSFSDSYAVNKYLQLTARIAHLINTGSVGSGVAAGKPYKEVVHAFGLIGGGYQETSFNLQYRVPDPKPGDPDKERETAYEIIYSDASMAAYRTWLRTHRYGNIHALNASWGTNFADPGTPANSTNIGDQTAAFAQLNKNNIPKPGEYHWGVGYTDNNATKDLFAFQIWQHAEFYRAVNNAVKNPSSVISGLSSSTGIKTACYVTENHTFAEGVRFGVAPLKTMYEDFDIHFSSTTAGDSPSYYSNNVLWDYALRAAEFAGTFGGTAFGQERDGDAVEATVGYTKIYNVIKRYGAKYMVPALQSNLKEWNSTDGIPLMQDLDGVWRTRRESLKKLWETEFKNVEHPAAPSFPTTLTFTERQAVVSSNNPNGIKDAFKNASNLDGNGVAANLIKVQVIKDIDLIDLTIDADSVQTYAFSGSGGTYYWVGFNARINGQPINNGYALQYTVNGGTTWLQAGRMPGEKLVTHLSNITAGSGTVSVKIRPAGRTSPVSNTVSILIPS